MKQINLGSQGLTTSTVGLGCMGMSVFYGASDDAQSEAAILHALDRGITFFDTAELYGGGHNESLLGKALAARRDEAVVATKFGLSVTPEGAFNAPNGRPEYVFAACENSLERLGIETIDLYYQHRVDPETPIEETVGAMSRLVEQGKVRFLGLSEAGAETLRRAHREHPISALQSEYSLFARDQEDSTLPVCRELGIGFVAYSPLGRGILTGAITTAADIQKDNDIRPGMPWYSSENLGANLELVGALKQLAGQRDVTPGQLAIAWLIAQGVVPIPGSRRNSRIDENAAAADIVLTEDDLQAIEDAVPAERVAGMRMGEEFMKQVGL